MDTTQQIVQGEEIVVSVILPNYNHAPFLKERIDSILEQTFQNFELILLDDCSKDDSVAVLRGYASHPKVSYLIINDKNSGSTFKQWQRGFDLAKGRYIWIAESDDVAEKDFLEATIGALENTPNAVLAFTGSQMIDSKGEMLDIDWDKFHDSAIRSQVFESNEFILTRMLWQNSIYNASMTVFRKSCLNRINPIYNTFRYCGDWSFWTDICTQGNIVCIPRKLNKFRQHNMKVSPKAEKEGLYFIEGGMVMLRNMETLHLSSLERKVVEGRMLKRFEKATKHDAELRQRILCSPANQLLKGGLWSKFLYETNKLFHFTKL